MDNQELQQKIEELSSRINEQDNIIQKYNSDLHTRINMHAHTGSDLTTKISGSSSSTVNQFFKSYSFIASNTFTQTVSFVPTTIKGYAFFYNTSATPYLYGLSNGESGVNYGTSGTNASLMLASDSSSMGFNAGSNRLLETPGYSVYIDTSNWTSSSVDISVTLATNWYVTLNLVITG